MFYMQEFGFNLSPYRKCRLRIQRQREREKQRKNQHAKEMSTIIITRDKIVETKNVLKNVPYLTLK